jgi:hypothetical protein
VLGLAEVPVRVLDIEAIIRGEAEENAHRCLFWAEVKTKAQATYTRFLGQHEHGFSRRLYEEYRTVSRSSGGRLHLWVVEMSTGEVRRGDLAEMPEPRVYSGEFMDRGGTVFWPREAYETVANWRHDPELAAIMHGQEEAQARPCPPPSMTTGSPTSATCGTAPRPRSTVSAVA